MNEPHADDELHHFGYSLDQKRLIVPGLFSNRIHVFDVDQNPRWPRLVAVNDVGGGINPAGLGNEVAVWGST